MSETGQAPEWTLVDRLRNDADRLGDKDYAEAASLIERQQKEIEALKSGLATIIELSDYDMEDGDRARQIARDLLNGGSK